MSARHFHSLESRRLLSADLGISIKQTTVPDSLLAGVASKPLITLVNLSNTGDALTKNDPNVVVTIALRSAGNVDTTVGTTTLQAKTLKSLAKTIPVKTLIPASLAAGTYTLVAIVSGGGDANSANNAATGKTVTAAAANADLVLETTEASGTVGAGSKVGVTASVTNNGNIAAKTKGTLEVLFNGAVVQTFSNVAVSALPGKTVKFKPITVIATNATTSAATGTITVRYTPSPALLGDSLANNVATAATLTVSAPPVSALSQYGLGNSITFKGKFTGFGTTGGEAGTWVDSNGRSGTFNLTGSGSSQSRLFSMRDGSSTGPIVILDTLTLNTGYTIGGKTLTFGQPSAGSAGYIGTNDSIKYFKLGK